jgi:hypothetical protein
VPIRIERGPMVKGTTVEFGVGGRPAALRVERSRWREFLLLGDRPDVYDLTVAGVRVVYEGAIRAARAMLIIHLAFAGVVTFVSRSLSDQGRLTVFILLGLTAIGVQVLARPVLSRWPPKAMSNGEMASPWGLLLLLMVPLVAVLALMFWLGIAPAG